MSPYDRLCEPDPGSRRRIQEESFLGENSMTCMRRTPRQSRKRHSSESLLCTESRRRFVDVHRRSVNSFGTSGHGHCWKTYSVGSKNV